MHVKSLRHRYQSGRVENILTWVRRLSRLCAITALPQELVHFDLQQMENPVLIEANGRGHRRIILVDTFGFPRGYRHRKKRYLGYQTGDLVRAAVSKGVRRGTHVGRVTVKASGYFTIQTKTGKVTDVAHRFCHPQQRTDGYRYRFGVRLSSPPNQPERSACFPLRLKDAGSHRRELHG